MTPTATAQLSSRTALEQLRALNGRFIENFVTNDAEGHAALLHPEFVTIQSDGSVLDRATYLEQWATGYDPAVIPYWETRDEQITVVGDVALVRSVNRFLVVRDGTETMRASIYTDTYVRIDGSWTCLQAQITPTAVDATPDAHGTVSIYLRGVRQLP